MSLEIVAPRCGKEGAAMDKPQWCSKSTGNFCATIACNNSRKSRRNLSFLVSRRKTWIGRTIKSMNVSIIIT